MDTVALSMVLVGVDKDVKETVAIGACLGRDERGNRRVSVER